MDITAIIGIIVAIAGLLSGMILKGVPLSNLANIPAILIILVGTTGAVINATPKTDLVRIGSLFKLALFGRKQDDSIVLVRQFVEYSQKVRKDGLLTLEGEISSITDPFTRMAMTQLMTGQDISLIKAFLETEIDNIDERHRGLANIFSQAGSYAPTLGVLGAVVGLIAAMGFLEDTEQLAHAIAGAFMATVYGIFTGYILWNPFSNRLRRLNAHEINSKRIVAEGVLLLMQGFSPTVVEDHLMSYLTPKQAEAYNASHGGAR